MIRLFVGLSLPDEVRLRLAALASGIPGARWLEPETYHVTLRFIGEVEEQVGEAIHDLLDGIRAPAFPLELAGMGAFDTGHRAHTLWAGVEKSAALVFLRDKVESAVVRAGLPPETRKFSPHVTLARIKDQPGRRLHDFLSHHGLFRAGPFMVDRFVLYSSHLGRTGATYTAEAEYPLETVDPYG
jgi:2'-5' RNA ligase